MLYQSVLFVPFRGGSSLCPGDSSPVSLRTTSHVVADRNASWDTFVDSRPLPFPGKPRPPERGAMPRELGPNLLGWDGRRHEGPGSTVPNRSQRRSHDVD